MGKLIDADALIEHFKKHDGMWSSAGCCIVLDNAPTVDAVPLGAYEQMRWQFETAEKQLNDYGVQFGEKADCVRVVRCKDCELHDKCIVEDVFKLAEMEDGYCAVGKRKEG